MSMKRSAVAGLVAGAAVILAGCGCGQPQPTPPRRRSRRSPDRRSQQAPAHRPGDPPARHRDAARARGACGQRPAAGARKVIPYSAVVYDTDGSTWTYVNTAPRTYVREPITIAAIQGDVAVLDRGPAGRAPRW